MISKKRKVEILYAIMAEYSKDRTASNRSVHGGLCSVASLMESDDIIDYSEYKWFYRLVDKHLESKCVYLFPPGDIKRRYTWINERVEEITNPLMWKFKRFLKRIGI